MELFLLKFINLCTMADLKTLYQQVILDHNRHPRHYGKTLHGGHTCLGKNPVCGDQFLLTVLLEDNHIKDITFQGEGCAISKASASTMMEMVLGKSTAEADELIQTFVTSLLEDEAPLPQDARIQVFQGVKDFPGRVKCATLAWHTLHDCLHGKNERIEE